MALRTLVERSAAERVSLIYRAVIADFRCLADDNTEPMVDEYTAADGRSRMDLDAGQTPRDMRNKTAEPFHALHPAPVRPAMQDDRMQARIAGQYLPGRASGGITFDDAGDIFTDAAKHIYF